MYLIRISNECLSNFTTFSFSVGKLCFFLSGITHVTVQTEKSSRYFIMWNSIHFRIKQNFTASQIVNLNKSQIFVLLGEKYTAYTVCKDNCVGHFGFFLHLHRLYLFFSRSCHSKSPSVSLTSSPLTRTNTIPSLTP